MLNYGAATQVYMNYNTDALANASLTEIQLGYVEEYNASMVDAAADVDSSKIGAFARNGFGKCYPSISLLSDLIPA